MIPSRHSPIYALAAGLAVLICSPPPAMAETAGITLWEARLQHVRLIPRDQPGANRHPATPAAAEIRNGLAQLTLEGGDAPIELLTAEERGFVADQLAKALPKAGAGQDVEIATIGMRRGMLGLGEPRLTTLRVFMAEDGLNLILGEVQAEPPDETSTYRKVDPRLVSFAEGRRAAPARPESGLRLAVAPGSPAVIRRSDWAVLPAAAMAVPEPGSEAARKQAEDRMERVQREVQDIREEVRRQAPPAASPPAGESRTVEDRLEQLNRLKAKGLITPQEYADKRRRILDSF